MGFVGLETIESKDDMALPREDALQPALVSKAQSEQFFVALQKIGDGALGNSNRALLQHSMDFGDAAMIAVA